MRVRVARDETLHLKLDDSETRSIRRKIEDRWVALQRPPYPDVPFSFENDIPCLFVTQKRRDVIQAIEAWGKVLLHFASSSGGVCLAALWTFKISESVRRRLWNTLTRLFAHCRRLLKNRASAPNREFQRFTTFAIRHLHFSHSFHFIRKCNDHSQSVIS